MIYFLDNSLQLQKIVTSKNTGDIMHHEELNGLIHGNVELDLFYANKFLILGIDHVGYYYKNEFYLHKIQRVEYDHVNESVKVVFRHIFFEDMLFGPIIKDVRPKNQDAVTILRQTIEANTRWQIVMTDVTGTLSTNFYWQVPYEVIEFVNKNFRVDMFPKILFDGKNINGFQLHVKNATSSEVKQRIPFGSRVLDLKYEEDFSEIVTKLVGHGKGEEVGDGYGRRINFSEINFNRNGVKSPVGSVYMEDPSVTNTYGNDGQTPREGRVVFEDIESPSELAEATYQHYLDVSRPQMLFTADVTDLGDVNIGDSVLIVRREYDVYFKARIHKLSVNLLNPEDAQVELGDYEHFKESKVERKSREKNNRVQKQLSDRIARLKREANDFIDGEFSQAIAEFEQNYIDQKAQIEADLENMTNFIEGKSTEFTDKLNSEITQTKAYAEQQAQSKADSVQTNLDSFKESHQQLYDEVTGNILDIDTFLGDKSKTLKQQFDTVRTDFGTLQKDLEGVESDLTATKTDLQKQLDEARAELDGLEVGGRNLLPAFTSERWSGFIPNSKTVEMPNPYELIFKAGSNPVARIDLTLEPNTNYTMTFNSDHQRYYIYRKENGELTTIVRTITEGSDVFTFNTEDTTEFQLMFNSWSQRVDRDRHVWKPKLEKGTIATDWTPAPEDTEQKITTLNQQVEFIDGQLSAKLEQTDLLPINNKITEYGNSLTANAQSIESLISKTELHDGDITKWSNQTTANAESITSALSRISNTESGLTKAQTDIIANADGLSTLITRVGETESGIESLSTSLTAEAGKVGALITKTDGHDTQLTNIEAKYDSIQTTVAKNNDWLGTYGSAAEQTIAGFEQKVWKSDIHNPNIIPFNNLTLVENRKQWLTRVDDSLSYLDEQKMIRIVSYTSPYNYVQSPYVSLQAGETYTLSFKSLIGSSYNLNDLMQYTYVVYPDRENVLLRDLMKRELIGSAYDVNIYKFTVTFTAEETTDMARILIGADVLVQGQRSDLFIGEPKLELGERATLYNNALSIFEQRADELKLAVTDSDGLASVIALSPSAIDLISDKINVTGNVNIKGGVTALAVDAIEGNFARLFANELTTDVIKSSHIQASTTLVDKLFSYSARIDELITKTHFVNSMHALTLDVIDLNASNIRTRLLSANTIEAEWLKSGTALLDKVFASTAMFERMMAKSGFVTTLNTVSIDTDRLTIRRYDGAAIITEGLANFDYNVQLFEFLHDDTISWDGQWYRTQSGSSRRFMIGSFRHSGRYLKFNIMTRLNGSSPLNSEHVIIKVASFGGTLSYNVDFRYLVRRGETGSQEMVVDLGRPTFTPSMFYLELRRDPTSTGNVGNIVQARANRAWIDG